MAEAFIGLSVLTTLKDPPGAKVRGLVIDVADQQLTLNKGMPLLFPCPCLPPTMLLYWSLLTMSFSDMARIWVPSGGADRAWIQYH